MHLTQSSPTPEVLGTLNGLAQTFVSFIRALGPAGATALFSLGVERGVWWGYGVFGLFTLGATGSVWIATMLPSGEEMEGRVQ